MSSNPTLKQREWAGGHEQPGAGPSQPFQIEAGSIPSGESWGSSEVQTVEVDGIPSGEAFGSPILLSQHDLPLNTHTLTGGPENEQLRSNMHRDLLRLTRRISAIESPGLIPPAEASSRWIQRVTGLSQGEIGLQELLNLSRDFSQGHSLHLLESGKRSLSLEFANFARDFDSLLNRDQPWQSIGEKRSVQRAPDGAASPRVREDPGKTVADSDSESVSVNDHLGKSATDSNQEAAGAPEHPAIAVPELDSIQSEPPMAGGLAGNDAPVAEIKLEPSNRPEQRRRGRKVTFSAEQIDQARELKLAGKSNHEAAKVLYRTSSPTENHRRAVSTILKHHSEKNTLKKT